MRLPDASRLPGLQSKFQQLEKAQRRQVLTATVEGQTVFTITNGSYVVGSETLRVTVGGVPQPPDAYTETNSTTVTLSEGVPVGKKVILEWLEGKLPVAFGHNTSHYSDGQDPIDVTQLKNYKAEVADKIGTLQTNVNSNTTQLTQKEYNAKTLGVKGDGVVDDLQKIKDAFTTIGQGRLFFPSGVYSLSGRLDVPVGIEIVGRGKGETVFEFPTGMTTVPIMIKNTSNKVFKDFTVREKNHNFSSGSTAAGVYVQNCSNVTLEHVDVEGFFKGFDFDSANKDITLRKCKGSYTGSYGFTVKNTNGLLLDDCIAEYNWLDGFKLEKSTMNVTVRGGRSSNNGQSFLISGSGNGNGLDAYAGGESFIIDGLVAESNQGAGVYMKTGPLNTSDQTTLSSVRNFEVRSVLSRNNTGSGLDINRVNGDVDSTPLVAQVNVFGGVYEKNGGNGIYLRGRNITLHSPICKDNQQHGISTSASAYSITIIAPTIIANGKAAAATYNGVTLYGRNIRIFGGVIDGANDDYANIGDFAGATSYHYTSIRCYTGSDNIVIRDVVFRNNTFSHNVRIDGGGFCQVHYGVSNMGYATYGSQGSTIFYNGTAYIKVTDSTDASNTGWESQYRKSSTQADSTATDVATLKADFNSLLTKLKNAKLMA